MFLMTDFTMNMFPGRGAMQEIGYQIFDSRLKPQEASEKHGKPSRIVATLIKKRIMQRKCVFQL